MACRRFSRSWLARFTAVGLLLAVLHGIEAAFWAAAYVWLGALDSPEAAILYSVERDGHPRRFGAYAATALANDGRSGGGQRHAVVRNQHGLYLHGHAVLPIGISCFLSVQVTARSKPNRSPDSSVAGPVRMAASGADAPRLQLRTWIANGCIPPRAEICRPRAFHERCPLPGPGSITSRSDNP